MIEEEYISFETAKLAKEKGFDIPTRYGFSERRSLVRVDTSDNWNQDKELYSRPTQSLLSRWLREKYGLYVCPFIGRDYSEDADGEICDKWEAWYFDIFDARGEAIFHNEDNCYDTYEEAMEAGLQEALKMI